MLKRSLRAWLRCAFWHMETVTRRKDVGEMRFPLLSGHNLLLLPLLCCGVLERDRAKSCSLDVALGGRILLMNFFVRTSRFFFRFFFNFLHYYSTLLFARYTPIKAPRQGRIT